MPFLSSSDDSLQDAYIILKKVDDFEIVLKTSSVLVWGTIPLNLLHFMQSLLLKLISSCECTRVVSFSDISGVIKFAIGIKKIKIQPNL